MTSEMSFSLEMFRWKQKEAADFIKRHVKGWMLPARFRAAWIDGEWAGLGDPPTGFIVDYDEKSPTYKKLIPYFPHIEKIDELFQLYMELCGNISLFYRRLRESPTIFPEFEPWVDPRNVKRFKMAKYPGGGYYPKGKGTLVSILTNPIYIGYRTIRGVVRRNRQGEKIIDHEPVIDREVFDFAFYRLSKTDLDGNPIEGTRPRRFYHQESMGEFGLLKFRITSHQGEVRTHIDNDNTRGTGSYHIQTLEEGCSLYHVVTHTSIPCDELDTIIVDRLMEHVREISSNQEEVAEYEVRAKKIREERHSKIKQIVAAMNEIEHTQLGLTISLGHVTKEVEEEIYDETRQIKQRRQQLITEQIDRLEKERLILIRAQKTLEEEAASDLGTLDKELDNLEEQWPDLAFERRRSLLNFLAREVIIDMVSTHWMHVQVFWLHEEWGQEEIYYYRRRGVNIEWLEEEIEIVREHYAAMPKFALMALLPHRGWLAIRNAGQNRLKIARRQGKLTDSENLMRGLDESASYSDMEFMQSKGIAPRARSTNWERQCSPCSLS